MNTQPIAETMDSAIQRLENLKSKTMHQLIPNTYTICEITRINRIFT